MAFCLKDAILTLESRNCRQEDKEETYAKLVRSLRSGDTELNEDALSVYGSQLRKLIARDILNSNESVVISTLEILQRCLRDPAFKSLTRAQSSTLLQPLMKCLHQTTSLEVIKLTLACLAEQDFPLELLSANLSSIMDHLEEANAKLKAKSVSPIDEVSKVVKTLSNQIEKDLKGCLYRWARLIFPGLASTALCVRERCTEILERFAEDLSNSSDMRKYVIKAIGAGLAQSLKCLVVKEEESILKIWSLIIHIAGKDLHKGPSINSMLEVIEVAFKGSPRARCLAFKAWKSLIVNFALDTSVICDPKRVKLLMMVLKVDNAKTEDVAKEKLFTWWHFVVSAGPKVSTIFEQVLSPLLQFCVGNGKLNSSSGLLTASPRLVHGSPAGLMGSSKGPSQNLPVFPSLQRLGCQVVARVLAKTDHTEKFVSVTWELDALPQEMLSTGQLFVKHAPTILAAALELFKGVGKDVEESLVLYTWGNLVSHLRAAVENNVIKSESREVYSTFLSLLRTLVQDQVFSGDTLMTLLEYSSNFPQKVLASTAYNVAGGQTLLRGCPALLLTEELLSPVILNCGASNDSYLQLFSTLVSAGAHNPQGSLGFLHTVMKTLDQRVSGQFKARLDAQLLWKMWSSVGYTLKDSIAQTDEVNQGDALEYNFDCVYSVLLFPVKHQLATHIVQTSCKAMQKLWNDLYQTFARLSALVATAEANVGMEELSSKILQAWSPEFKEPVQLEFLISICYKLLDCTDYSALSNTSTSGGLTLSPSKWARRRQRPMGNLHSLVCLIEAVSKELNSYISPDVENKTAQKSDAAHIIVSVAHTLVDTCVKLFSHITSNVIISHVLAKLAHPLSQVFQPCKSNIKLSVPAFQTKLEKLWQEMTQCLTGRYTGQFDSELLDTLAPLLEVNLVHSRRGIKNLTLTFWNTTFSRSSSLVYPEGLKPVLCKVKDKTSILLPGWISSDDIAVIAETPYSEMSMGESQVPPPVLTNMPSPKRQRGSLLNKDVSPNRKLSPLRKSPAAKVISPKDAKHIFSSAWNKIAVDSMKEEDFVVIKAPARKKLVLTEHQKEVMKEKRVLPAMYNNLERSQDTSLMAQFNTDTQQSMTQSPDVIVINSSGSQIANPFSKLGQSERSNSSDSMQPPKGASGKRRSVRIKELQIDSVQDIEMRFEEDGKRKGSRKQTSQQRSESNESKEESEKLIIPSQDSEEVMNTDVDSHIENSGVIQSSVEPTTSVTCEETDKKKDCITSFGIFRKDSSKPDSVESQEDDDTVFSSSQDSQIRGRPRRVSLRRVNSQNDVPKTGDKEKPEDKASTSGDRTPRRVPFKKISDLQQNEQEGGEKNTQSPSKARNLKSTGAEGKLDGWLMKPDKNGAKDKVESVETKASDTSIRILMGTEISPVEEPVTCTLVEDTQSPFKATRSSSQTKDSSIAETPTKISPDPAQRPHARKLFSLDDAATPLIQNLIKPNKELVPEHESEIDLSQGFETEKQQPEKKVQQEEEDEDSMFGFSQLEQDVDNDSVLKSKEGEMMNDGTSVSEDMPKESTQSSSEAAFLFEQMPTLTSFQKMTQSGSSKSTSDESVKTSSSSSNEVVDKISSSSESDFNPSKPTLEEESQHAKKRKMLNPKKYSPVKRPRRTSRNHSAHKKCPCCKQNVENCVNKESLKSSQRLHKASEAKNESVDATDKEPNQEQAKSNSEASLEKMNNVQNESKEEAVTEEKTEEKLSDIEVSGGEGKEQDKKLLESLVEVCEVTPDMKSPSSDTPHRRHSSVKRTRSAAKHLSPLLTKKSFPHRNLLKEAEMLAKSQTVTECDGLVKEPSLTSSPGSVKRNKWKKSLSPSPSRQRSTRSRHQLRVRSKMARAQSPSGDSPPRKMKRVSVNDSEDVQAVVTDTQEEVSKNDGKESAQTTGAEPSPVLNTSFEDEDNIPLAVLKSQEIVNDAQTEEKMDENVEEREVDQHIPEPSEDKVDENKGKDKEMPLSKQQTETGVNEQSVTADEEEINKVETSCALIANKEVSYFVDSEPLIDSEPVNSESVVDSEMTQHSEPVNSESVVDSEMTQHSEPVNSESIVDSEMTQQSAEQVSPLAVSVTEPVTVESQEDSIELEKTSGRETTMEISQDHLQAGQTGHSETVEPSEDKSKESVNQTDMYDQDTQPYQMTNSGTGNVATEEEKVTTGSEKNGESAEPFVQDSVAEEKNDLNTEERCEKADGAGLEVLTVDTETTTTQTEPSSCVAAACQTDAGDDDSGEDVELGGDAMDDEQSSVDAQQLSPVGKQASEKQEEKAGSVQKLALYDWSPSRSPSTSILKKMESGTPPASKTRRVSFADPVVSGESPVRAKYHSESQPSSPQSSLSGSPNRKSFSKYTGKSPGYRRKLDPSLRKEASLSRASRLNPTPSPISQLSYKATPESQLDDTRPIFPKLLQCTAPLDSILPQLTSSLWYRGLCQLMKGRNLHTIGDLCALTEVQVNQLPVRAPKIDTVRCVLTAYMAQHGPSNIEGADATESCANVGGETDSPVSKGATLGQAVTPSSIADDDIRITNTQDGLEDLSPIKDPDLGLGMTSCPHKKLDFSKNLDEDQEPSPPPVAEEEKVKEKEPEKSEAGGALMLSCVNKAVLESQRAGLKNVSTSQLMDLHQHLTALFAVVGEEMKSRLQSS